MDLIRKAQPQDGDEWESTCITEPECAAQAEMKCQSTSCGVIPLEVD